MNTSNMNDSTWTVTCSDGDHSIAVERNADERISYNLYVDTQPVRKLTPVRKGLVVHLEYNFICYGEKLTLVVYGGKIDLVHRGVLQSSKLPYEPDNVLPISVRVGLIALNLLSALFYLGVDLTTPTIVFRILISITMILSSSIMINTNAASPFYSKKKKITSSIFMLLLSVFVVFTCSFLLGVLENGIV